jgi:hypothetical protein
MRWFPYRCFSLSADGGFGAHRIACFPSLHQNQLPFVSRFAPDRQIGKNGRPRLKGQKAPSPEQIVEQTEVRAKMKVNWYGGQKREVEIVDTVGYWFKYV